MRTRTNLNVKEKLFILVIKDIIIIMNTTIAVSPETRDKIIEFGNKGETYDDILARILNSAKERQVQELLMDERGTMTMSEARARLNRKR